MIERARLHAPSASGAVLVEPPLERFESLLSENRQLLGSSACTHLGRPLPELRELARREVWTQSCAYHQKCGEPTPECARQVPSSFLVSGHQPELIHPGVWLKNFTLSGLAASSQAAPLNVIVDSDTAKSMSMRLPAWRGDIAAAGWAASVHRAKLPIDRWSSESPWEERAVLDEELFASVPARAKETTSAWPFAPMLPTFWRRLPPRGLIGERIVAGRRACERAWGCHNLEVPLSRLETTESFAWFAGQLLSELPRFHAVYNNGLADYRRRHRVRSRAHPAPDLRREGDWLESPFWGWRTATVGRRLPVFARKQGDRLLLRLGNENGPSSDRPWSVAVPEPAVAPKAFVSAWRECESTGLKIRSRALLTTLFLRLFVADLFVHGIGGAKYDELTDALCSQFYELKPPGFLAVSGTLLLPMPELTVRDDDRRQVARLLRDHFWNPQRHGAVEDDESGELAKEKAELIAWRPDGRREKRERYRRIRAVTEALREQVDGAVNDLKLRLGGMEKELKARSALERRDYAFCLFPEQQLRDFCTQPLSRK